MELDSKCVKHEGVVQGSSAVMVRRGCEDDVRHASMNDWMLIFPFGSADLLGYLTALFTNSRNSNTDLRLEL